MAKKKHSVVNRESMAPVPAAVPSPMQAEQENERQGGYDLNTIMDGENIKSDPKRMNNVLKAHAKRTATINSISKLKDVYDMKYGSGKKKPSGKP